MINEILAQSSEDISESPVAILQQWGEARGKKKIDSFF